MGGVFFIFTLPFLKDRLLRPLSNLSYRRFKTIHVRNHNVATLDKHVFFQVVSNHVVHSSAEKSCTKKYDWHTLKHSDRIFLLAPKETSNSFSSSVSLHLSITLNSFSVLESAVKISFLSAGNIRQKHTRLLLCLIHLPNKLWFTLTFNPRARCLARVTVEFLFKESLCLL